jgi:hypothetical protein
VGEGLTTSHLKKQLVNKMLCRDLEFGSGYGLVAGSYEHGNEYLSSVRGREFLTE